MFFKIFQCGKLVQIKDVAFFNSRCMTANRADKQNITDAEPLHTNMIETRLMIEQKQNTKGRSKEEGGA